MSDTVEEVDTVHKRHEEPETDAPAARPTATGGVTTGTLARLLVGSALLGWEVMTTALQAEGEEVAGEVSTLGEEPLDAPPTGAPQCKSRRSGPADEDWH